MIADRLHAAIALARAVSAITMEVFRPRAVIAESKADGSPVTVADRRAEEFLRRELSAQFPNDGFMGEETGQAPSRSGYRWVVDPIDGTASFMRGVPLWGTMVACEHDGRPVVGVIDCPAAGEMVYGASGLGAWHRIGGAEPVRSRVAADVTLGQATVCTSSIEGFTGRGRMDAFGGLAGARVVRTWGDCFGYLMVATGRIHAMVDPVMQPWDIAALVPIIQEAGGAVTSWTGGDPVGSRDIVAGTPGVHRELLRVLG